MICLSSRFLAVRESAEKDSKYSRNLNTWAMHGRGRPVHDIRHSVYLFTRGLHERAGTGLSFCSRNLYTESFGWRHPSTKKTLPLYISSFGIIPIYHHHLSSCRGSQCSRFQGPDPQAMA